MVPHWKVNGGSTAFEQFPENQLEKLEAAKAS